MSTMVRETVKCGKCNNITEVTVLPSTNAFGSPDLDLRPPEMKRSTMVYWLQECSHCGYINSALQKNNGIDMAFLQQEEYKNCDDINFTNMLAHRFYKYYKVMLELNDIEAAYIALLHTAWCCDDKEDTENARRCRLKMVDLFDKLPVKSKENETVIARQADVMRRAGMFDEVIKKYSNFKASETVVDNVIKFQIDLSRKKDDGCHRVEECMK